VDDGIAIPNNLPANMTILVRQRNGTFVDVGPKLHRAPAIRVDSHQIHKEAAKIDYDKLIDVLKNKTTGKGIAGFYSMRAHAPWKLSLVEGWKLQC
jgi:hypothetical protein